MGADLFIGTTAGLFVSADAGSSSLSTAVTAPVKDIVPLADGRLVAATDAGMFTSTLDRQTWLGVETNVAFNAVATDGTRLAATSFDGGLFVSSDGGGTWSSVTTPASVYLASVAFDTDGSLVLGAYGHGLVRVTY